MINTFKNLDLITSNWTSKLLSTMSSGFFSCFFKSDLALCQMKPSLPIVRAMLWRCLRTWMQKRNARNFWWSEQVTSQWYLCKSAYLPSGGERYLACTLRQKSHGKIAGGHVSENSVVKYLRGSTWSCRRSHYFSSVVQLSLLNFWLCFLCNLYWVIFICWARSYPLLQVSMLFGLIHATVY